LGAHTKPSRINLPQAATAAAAAPTLAGVAAAICLSPQTPAQAAMLPSAQPNSANQTTSHTITLPAAYHKAQTPAQLLAASQQAAKQKQASTFPMMYTVRPGDSLSAIAGKVYNNPAAWPAIYWANHSKLHWANIIDPGQVLTIPAEPSRIPKAPSALAPPTHTYVPRHAVAQSAPVESAPAQTTVTSNYSGEYPGGAFGACVVERESGGDPDIWNASGHWGLYQFSESTWIAYGGDPALFGSASVAEQNAVFATALAEGGQDNWAPYDGC
jgi:LysM repeat protein